MPRANAAVIASHSQSLRQLIPRFVRNRRRRRESAALDHDLRQQIDLALRYLDRNAIRRGDSRAKVESRLGPPPGYAGPDVWRYPGVDNNHDYRIEFTGGVVSAKHFDEYEAS